MIPSLLVVGAGPLQVPAIHEARALGIRSIAVDGNSSAVGLALCDAPYVADILDADAVCAIARRENIDGIMTLCTDAPVSTVAEVGQRMGLPVLSPQAAARATDKRLMREAFRASGAPSPRTHLIHSLAEARLAAESLGYPVVLKIGRGSGSRGVYRIDDHDAMQAAYVRCREWQKEGALLLEEWVDGEEVSVEGYCTDRDRSIVAITDKFLFPGVSPVEVGHCQPSTHAPLREQQIHSAVQAGLSALGSDLVRFSCGDQGLHQRSAVDRDRRPARRGPHLHALNPAIDGRQFGESRDPAGFGGASSMPAHLGARRVCPLL